METIRLGWRHIVLRVPREWEVIGHSKSYADGRLVLADRHGETLQAHWRELKSKPSLGHMLVELVGVNTDDSRSETKIRERIRDVAGWSVYFPGHRKYPAFAVRYQAEQKVALDLIFPPHPDNADADAVSEILSTYESNHGSDRVWAAFGIDITLPREMDIDEIDPLPGSQTMSFENARGEKVVVHRYGMMPLVLGGEDMATFFARVKGRKFMLKRGEDFTKDGRYPGVQLGYITRGKGGIEALLSRTWQGRVWVWRCDDIKRLYCLDHNAHEKRLIPDLLDRVVSQ
jgi:hypothetical protein